MHLPLSCYSELARTRTRTRTGINPDDTEAKLVGRRVRACDERKQIRGLEVGSAQREGSLVIPTPSQILFHEIHSKTSLRSSASDIS